MPAWRTGCPSWRCPRISMPLSASSFRPLEPPVIRSTSRAASPPPPTRTPCASGSRIRASMRSSSATGTPSSHRRWCSHGSWWRWWTRCAARASSSPWSPRSPATSRSRKRRRASTSAASPPMPIPPRSRSRCSVPSTAGRAARDSFHRLRTAAHSRGNGGSTKAADHTTAAELALRSAASHTELTVVNEETTTAKFGGRIAMTLQKTSIAIAVSLALGCVGNAHADQASDMQAKLDALQKQVQELQAQIGALRKKQEQAAPATAAAPAKAPANEVKAGKELVFKVGGGEVQLYGHADVSLDDQTNGMTGFIHNSLPVTGQNGWVPDVSSNLSNFGVRGDLAVSADLKGGFQFETEIAYAATPGASDQATDTTAQKF